MIRYFFIISCLSLDSYIKPQHKNATNYFCEVVYLLIPTSNHNTLVVLDITPTLFISWFLHQTTTALSSLKVGTGCLSLDSYIKPQLIYKVLKCDFVVYLLIPTSNHNPSWYNNTTKRLFISWFLHQTTTRATCALMALRCLSLDSYIKPQLRQVLPVHR